MIKKIRYGKCKECGCIIWRFGDKAPVRCSKPQCQDKKTKQALWPIRKRGCPKSYYAFCKHCGRISINKNKVPIICGRKACWKMHRRETAKNQWADPAHRKNMSRKASAQLYREYANGTRDKYAITQAANDRCRELCSTGDWHLKYISPWNSLKGEALELYRKRRAISSSMVGKRFWRVMTKKRLDGRETNIERAMACALDGVGIHRYQTEQLVGERYFADFLLPGKIIIECDGIAWHERTPEQVEYTKQRHDYLESCGYTVLHFNENDIFGNMSNTLVVILEIYARHNCYAEAREYDKA